MRRRHWGEGAKRPEARCHPEGADVEAAGMWNEGRAHYPGRSVILPCATGIERYRDGMAEVSRGHTSQTNQLTKDRTCQVKQDWFSDCFGHKPRKRAAAGSSGRNPRGKAGRL